jgi:ribonuclease HI
MWKKVKCKGKDVWAKCNSEQRLIMRKGLVEIRYSQSKGAKIYRAKAENISGLDDSPQETTTSSSDTGFGSAKTRTADQQERARAAAASQIEDLPENAVVCFTDGSCRGNPGPSGVGVFVQFPNGSSHKHSKFLGTATNNIAELTALSDAIDVVQSHDGYEDALIVLFTDSKYAQGVLCKNWKAKANRPLIQSIKTKIRSRGNIKINWIAGHAGILGNEEADALANLAIDEK